MDRFWNQKSEQAGCKGNLFPQQKEKREILETYMLRWQIEIYFKLTKSYLKLRTECHSTSYDALTSHMVVVAIRYMILAVERFRNSDRRSLEDLFRSFKEITWQDCRESSTGISESGQSHVGQGTWKVAWVWQGFMSYLQALGDEPHDHQWQRE